ncbi:hypothetical protein ES703_00378 [subsurface metagenome]
METLAEFQKRNCKGCFYADDEKVGTGQACCTYPQPIKLEVTLLEIGDRDRA